jgi:hypothetical protein
MTPSMFNRTVHRAFGWAFIRAVTSDPRQWPVRLRGASSADRMAARRAIRGRLFEGEEPIVHLMG